MDIVNKVARLITEDPSIINENSIINRPEHIEVNISDELYNNSAICDYMREAIKRLVKFYHTYNDVKDDLGFKGIGNFITAKIARNNAEVIERLYKALENRILEINNLNNKYMIYKYQNSGLCASSSRYNVEISHICGYDSYKGNFTIGIYRLSAFVNEAVGFLEKAIETIEADKEKAGQYGKTQFENRVRS